MAAAARAWQTCQHVLLLHVQVLADFAAERASVVAAATSQVSASGSEVEALRRLLQLKGRELQQLRQLGQEVLLQRSEVEIFLLSSLHQVGTCEAACVQRCWVRHTCGKALKTVNPEGAE